MSAIVFAYHDVGCMGLRVLQRLGVEITDVYTHADDPGENAWFHSVTRTCAELGLRAHVGVDPNSEAELDRIRASNPLAFFSLYYRDLLRAPLLSIPRRGGVNLHGSLLPRYRGRAPVNWQILHGETQGGVTLHYMVTKPDAGDIVDQEAFPIGPDDTATDVYARMLPAAERVIERSAIGVLEGTAPRIKQLESKATTFGRRRPEDGLIDWRLCAEDVRNLVRAVTKPYPGAFTFAHGQRLFVWHAEHELAGEHERTRSLSVAAAPGHASLEAGSVFVTCGDRRRLRLTRIEIDGKEVPAREMLGVFGREFELTAQPTEGR